MTTGSNYQNYWNSLEEKLMPFVNEQEREFLESSARDLL